MFLISSPRVPPRVGVTQLLDLDRTCNVRNDRHGEIGKLKLDACYGSLWQSKFKTANAPRLTTRTHTHTPAMFSNSFGFLRFFFIKFKL
jgi:hypothetical protein